MNAPAPDPAHVGKRLDIQILRAMAVLLVVAYHLPGSWHLGGGFVGVDVFFAISGYVITESILKSSSGDLARPRFFLQFMRRRCRRLVPALALTVAAAGLLIMFVGPADQARDGIHSALASLLFVSNYWFLRHFDSYWNPLVAHNPLLHMWSLAVEFQVYLAFPIVFIAVMRILRVHDRPAQLRWVAIVLAVLSLLSLALFAYLLDVREALVFGKLPQSVAFYTPFPRFWEFGAGAITALALGRARSADRRIRFAIKAAALVLGIASIAMLATAESVGLWIIPAIAATATLLALPTAVAERAGVLGAAERLLVWLGDRSYSIYLSHWPFMALLIWKGHVGVKAITVALVATLVASDLSYRFVEQARWPDWRAIRGLTRLSRPLWGFGLALIVLAASAWAIHANWVIHTASAYSVATPFPPSQVDATAATLPMYDCGALAAETHCDNAGPDAPELVIIGDSLGYRLLPAVQYVATQHHLNASMFWSGGCGIEFQQCPPNVRDYLESHRIAGIVIAQNFSFASVYVNGAEADGGLKPACDPAKPIAECPAHLEAVRAFEARAAKGLAELTTITPNILMALPFPQQALTFPNCLTSGAGGGSAKATADYACGWTSVDWQRTRQGLYPTAVEQVAARYKGVVLWDPVTVFCTDTRCPAVINSGEVVMDDAIHMTMEASRYGIPTLERFVANGSSD